MICLSSNNDRHPVTKHVAVLTIYRILLLLLYIYICVCVCCAFVGLDNKLYKMHGTYIKIIQLRFYVPAGTA